MSQAFYRKWRPRLWDQVIGQEHVIHTIQNAIRSDRIGHAYLFAGPRGTGKTTTARLLAKAANCLDPDIQKHPCNQCVNCIAVNEGKFLDLIEIDAASNTSVDDVRDLRDKINFSPTQGKYKVYIIDEVHMLSTAAFNALLKTLEEPPSHAIFILATTEVHKIPATVLSRCQRHEFRRIPVQEIVKTLKRIAVEENLQYDEEAFTLIARQATGSMRDAISLLDQLASTGDRITLEFAQQVLGTATNQVVIDLVDAILDRQGARGLDLIHQTLDSGSDPRQFSRQMVEYLRNVLLVSLGNSQQVDATQEVLAKMGRHAARFDGARLLDSINQFNQAATDSSSGWYPGLLLELAIARLVEEPTPAAQPALAPPAVLYQAESHPAAQVNASTPTSHAGAAPHTSIAAVQRPSSVASSAPVGTPPAQTAPVQAPSPVNLDSQDALRLIDSRWKEIITIAQQTSGPVSGLLNSGKPLRVKENTLVIGFASDVVQSKMETGKNIDIARAAIAQATGIQLLIRCTVVGKEQSTDMDNLPTTNDSSLLSEAINLGGKVKRTK